MLKKDYDYFKPFPYPVVIEDAAGHPLGRMLPNGTYIGLDASNVGKAVVSGGREYVVVWDGCKPDPMKNGNSKGRLLSLSGPPYVDSLTIYSYLATQSYKDYSREQTEAEKRAKLGIEK